MPGRGETVAILALLGLAAGSLAAVFASKGKSSGPAPPSLKVNGQSNAITLQSPSGVDYDASGPVGDTVQIYYASAPTPTATELFVCTPNGYCNGCYGSFDASGNFHTCDTISSPTGPGTTSTFYIGVYDSTTGLWGNWVAVTMIPAG